MREEEEMRRQEEMMRAAHEERMMKMKAASLYTEVAVRRAVDRTHSPPGSLGSAEFRRAEREKAIQDRFNFGDRIFFFFRGAPKLLTVRAIL